jgi:hypothetical protein
MMDTLMAEAAKLKKIQPAGEPIRWSTGAPARARFICAAALKPGP